MKMKMDVDSVDYDYDADIFGSCMHQNVVSMNVGRKESLISYSKGQAEEESSSPSSSSSSVLRLTTMIKQNFILTASIISGLILLLF